MAYPMTSKDYVKALERLQLTKEEAAMLFTGKSDRSGRRWARHGAPFHVALLLTLMHHFGITAEEIETLSERLHKRLEATQ